MIQQLLEKAGKYFFFQELYGMTELSPGCLALRPHTKNTKIGSCGTLFPGLVN
jgi:long-subunit acyl-CoA synthetase (AMP-forming)